MEQSFDIDLKAELKAILALCIKANHFGTAAQKAADVAFWDTVMRLDRRAKDGQQSIMPGRFVRLPAKDSYAYYIVVRVTKKAVKLTHIPYGQAYESNAVRDGEADVDQVERTLAWYDTIESRLQEMGRRPLVDRTLLNAIPVRQLMID